MNHVIEQWGPQRARLATELVEAALPGEELSLDELLACCWEDPPADGSDDGVVLGTVDGHGVVSVVFRGGGSVGAGDAFVKLIAVHPGARRTGRGHALLAAAESWAWERGAAALRIAGAPPFYLWPGVDTSATEMLCLAEARGYRRTGTGMNMTMPAAYRAPAPAGVVIRRVITDADVALVGAFVGRWWPEWSAELERAVEHGCCHGAFAESGGGTGTVVGFACHSVSRAGWLGPMGTDPQRRGAGVGNALVGQVCRDLMIAEYDRTEICWAGPVRFYAKSGASVSRTFHQFRLDRP